MTFETYFCIYCGTELEGPTISSNLERCDLFWCPKCKITFEPIFKLVFERLKKVDVVTGSD